MCLIVLTFFNGRSFINNNQITDNVAIQNVSKPSAIVLMEIKTTGAETCVCSYFDTCVS